MKYNGEHGYGRIGSFNITPETKLSRIRGEMSDVFINKLRNKNIESNKEIKFILQTYITKDHGQQEMIKDTKGNLYGYDHGSCCAWGF